jgi:hypothetical protein
MIQTAPAGSPAKTQQCANWNGKPTGVSQADSSVHQGSYYCYYWICGLFTQRTQTSTRSCVADPQRDKGAPEGYDLGHGCDQSTDQRSNCTLIENAIKETPPQQVTRSEGTYGCGRDQNLPTIADGCSIDTDGGG